MTERSASDSIFNAPLQNVDFSMSESSSGEPV